MATAVKISDNRSDAEKRLTSHLDNFKLPPDVDEIGESIAVEEKIKLPDDLAAAHKLLTEVQAESVSTPAEAKVRQGKVNQIAAQIHKLGQGAPLIVMTAQNTRDVSEAQSDHAKTLKLEVLAKLHPEVKELMDDLKAATAKKTKN